MKRTGRVILSLTLLGVVVIVVTRLLPSARRSPVTEALLRSSTIQTAPGYSFMPVGEPETILVAPDTWYSFSLPYQFGPMAGDVSTGRVSWQTKLPATGKATYTRRDGYPSAHGDGLIVTTTPWGGVLAFDELSRRQIWSVTPAEPIARVAWSDAPAVIATSGRHVYGVDPATGAIRWTYNLQGDLETDLLCTPEKVYLGVDGDQPKPGQSHEPLLVCLDPRDGRQLQRTPLPHRPTGLAASGDMIFCATYDSAVDVGPTLTAIRATTGKVAWESTNFYAPGRTLTRRPQGPAVDGNTVCLALEGHVYGFDAATGARLWTWPPANETNPPPEVGWPLCRDGIVYFTITDGAVALDGRSGRALWRYTRRQLSATEARAPATAIPPTLTGNAIALPYRAGKAYSGRVPRGPTVDIVGLPSILRAGDQPAAAIPIRTPVALTSAGLLLVVLIISDAVYRRLRTTIACLSLIAFGVTLWAWKSSYSSTHFLGFKTFASNRFERSEVATGIDWADGAMTFGRRQTVWDTSFPRPTQGSATAPLWWTRRPPIILANGLCLEEPATDLGVRRFAWTHHSRPSGTPLGPQAETSLTVPIWAVATLFALLPFAWLTGLWRDRGRHPKGHCPNCGYDLRATPGRCPECGHGTTIQR